MMNHRALPINTSSLSLERATPAPGNAKRFLEPSQENSATAMIRFPATTCVTSGVFETTTNDREETHRVHWFFHDQYPFVGDAGKIRADFLTQRGHEYHGKLRKTFPYFDVGFKPLVHCFDHHVQNRQIRKICSLP